MSRSETAPPDESAPPVSAGSGLGFLSRGFVAPVVLALAALAAWANSFGGPFVFDDVLCTIDNPSIRTLDPSVAFRGPDQSSVAGRPLLNYSLAICHAISGLETWSYHAFNLAIHVLAALTLYGVVRRTLLRPRLAARFGDSAGGSALAIALLWTVHPLHVQSVTYIVQRAEAMVGLFYLATLYCFVRYGEGREAEEFGDDAEGTDDSAFPPAVWGALAVAFCALGMATKEVMVTAPALLWLHDFVFGRRDPERGIRGMRWGMHAAFAATWAVLAALMAGGPRSNSAGFGLAVGPFQYLLTQFGVVTHYIRLAFWPDTLVLDYAWPPAQSFGEVALPAIFILSLAGATIAALRFAPALAFAGAWFFVILLPTSSFVPVADAAFEQRMYLPLAGIVAVVVVAGRRALEAIFREAGPAAPARAGVALVLTLAVALGARTHFRNRDFSSEVRIWETVTRDRPENPRAWNNLGTSLAKAGEDERATAAFRKTWEKVTDSRPEHPSGWNNLGSSLATSGEDERAIAAFRKALEVRPDYAYAHMNLGAALKRAGRTDEAAAAYEHALEIDPAYSRVHVNLGLIHYERGNIDKAIEHYRAALASDSGLVFETAKREAHNNLGNALAAKGDHAGAIAEYEAALAVDPKYPDAHLNLGNALADLGRLDEAYAKISIALRYDPENSEAHNSLGTVVAQLGRPVDAQVHFRKAIELNPNNAEAHANLGVALAQTGKPREALDAMLAALRIKPDDPKKLADAGNLHAELGELDAAIAAFARAAELAPETPSHWNNWGIALAKAGRVPESAEKFARAAELEPRADSTWINLGQAREASGDKAGAVEAYRRAVELSPDVAPHRNRLGVAIAGAGDLHAAIAEFEKALELAPDFEAARVNLERARAQAADLPPPLAGPLPPVSPPTPETP